MNKKCWNSGRESNRLSSVGPIHKFRLEKVLRETNGDIFEAAEQFRVSPRELMDLIVVQGISPDFVAEQVVSLAEPGRG